MFINYCDKSKSHVKPKDNVLKTKRVITQSNFHNQSNFSSSLPILFPFRFKCFKLERLHTEGGTDVSLFVDRSRVRSTLLIDERSGIWRELHLENYHLFSYAFLIMNFILKL